MNYKSILFATITLISACYAPATLAMEPVQRLPNKPLKLPYIERRFQPVSIEIGRETYTVQSGHLIPFLLDCSSALFKQIYLYKNDLTKNGASMEPAQYQLLHEIRIALEYEHSRIEQILNSESQNSSPLGRRFQPVSIKIGRETYTVKLERQIPFLLDCSSALFNQISLHKNDLIKNGDAMEPAQYQRLNKIHSALESEHSRIEQILSTESQKLPAWSITNK